MDSEKQLADLEKRLQQVYQKAKVGEEWTAYMEKASKEIKPLQTAYENAKKGNDAEARSQAAKALADKKREMTVADAHYRYLTDTLAKEISGLNEEAAALINDELPSAYALNYNGTVTELASKAPGYSFEMVDTKTINALAKTDTTLLPYKYVDGKKDVRWNTQAVNTQVLQGITQGESMKEIAARLNHVVGMDLKSAIRNARVAVSGAQNIGRMDMLRNARDKGVHILKVWSAIHDERTRDAHILLDGEEAEIEEPFDSELGEIMFPFDPNADPANVYNCRCRLEYKVVGFDKNAEDTASFGGAETTEEAIRQANSLGVKYAQFDKMPLEQANNAIRAVQTLPQDCRPQVIANGKDVSLVTGRPLGRKADQWWGVTYDYRPFSLNTKQLGYASSDLDGGLIVGLNTQKYKTLDALAHAKEENNRRYFERTGKYWSFNTSGEATAFHEIGHCYADVRGLPSGWEQAAERWAKDSKCDLLLKPDEAFAEAWAAYHTGNPALPKYIADIIKELE